MSFTFLSLLPQISILVILGLSLLFFLQNKIRYDIVAILVMLAVIASGVIGYEEVFANLGHPAVIIVASMFVISEAFVRSGVIDLIMSKFTFFYKRPIAGLGVLILLVTLLSAFVNSAGALAMVIPIAIHLAKKSHTSIAIFLLPLAFATHLGGFMTLIGTPRNILISDFREEATGTPFAMFDFLPVGGALAIIGVVFLIALAWRLIPVKGQQESEEEEKRVFNTEIYIPPESKASHMTVSELEHISKETIDVVAVYRDDKQVPVTPELELKAEDVLIIKGEIDSLTENTSRFNFDLVGIRAKEKFVTNEDDYITTEVMVPPYAKIIGSTWNNIHLAKRYGTNFIGIHRRDQEPTTKIADTVFWPNDILILQGRSDSINETIESLQLLSITNREFSFGHDKSILITILVITGVIAIATFNILPLSVIFVTGAILLILLNLVTLRQAYESIDSAVLFLLAGMITLGEALLESGAAESIAHALLSISASIGPVIMLVIVLLFSMLLADFMNSTASAVVMAPIAILVAQSMEISMDPFLIAVAIGASSAFLTPIGHESNAIVMREGGYTFSDYTRVGLPLEVMIAIFSVPLILLFWSF